jgi:hypothetical protein
MGIGGYYCFTSSYARANAKYFVNFQFFLHTKRQSDTVDFVMQKEAVKL